MLTVYSAAFGETIAKRHIKDGLDLSPPVTWSEIPAGTQSLAIILEDPDAPGGVFTHWLLWGVDPTRRHLPEGVVKALVFDGMRQGRNDYGQVGYGGPKPPPGQAHRYRLRLFALKSAIDVPPGADRSTLEPALFRETIETADLTSTYGRT